MYPVSVCIIARNEAHNLPASIESVRPYVAEVIVLDTGSTDNTVEIAQQLGARVYQEPWQNDFSIARNKAISYATNDYIFMLDADERLISESATALHEYIDQNPQKIFAGRVESLHRINAEQSITQRWIRIFPNLPEFRYQGIIHEQLTFRNQAVQTVETGIRTLHTGFKEEECARKNKFDRNLSLLLAELEKQPEDVYLAYQVGRTYFADKQYGNALAYLQTALDAIIEQNVEKPFFPTLMASIAYCLVYLKEWETLDGFISEGIRILPGYTDLYFAYGVGLIEQQNPDKAAMIPTVFKQCLELGEPDTRLYDMSTQGVGSYLAHYNLGIYHEIVQGQPEQARYHYTECLKHNYEPAAQRLKNL